jgi:hypothetical protein
MNIFRCANTRCGEALDVDHVTLVTTTHVRRFCSMRCVVEGHLAHVEALVAENGSRTMVKARPRWARPHKTTGAAVKAVSCPRCGAQIGEQCVAMNGAHDADGVRLRVRTHAERLEAAGWIRSAPSVPFRPPTPTPTS